MTHHVSSRPASASFLVLVGAMGLITGGLAGSAAVAAPSLEVSPQASVSSNGSWSSIGGSPDSAVLALAADTSGSLYAGGEFTAIDGRPFLRIARWGQPTSGGDDTWSALGAGLNDDVRTLAWDDTLYIGGEFSGEDGGMSLSRVATWARQGSDDTYISLASGIDPNAGNNAANPSVVFSILPTDDTVYVGGDFASASSVSDTRQMAGWVDDTWVSIGGGIPNCDLAERVLAFAEVPAQGLVVGGKFRCTGMSGTEDDTNIAIWDGTAWNPMNGGVRPPVASAGEIVTSLIPHGDLLYVGGEFNEAGPPGSAITVGSMATWDGTSWSGIGDGLAGVCAAANDFPEVLSMQLDPARGLLYAAGAFCRAGDDTVNSIVVRDLGVNEWIPLVAPGSVVGLTDSDTTEFVKSLLLDDTTLIVGGKFASAGGVGGPNNLARWTWDAPTGVNSLVASPGETVSITGSRFIGVPDSGGVFIGGIPLSSYTRVSTGQITGVVVPNGLSGTVAIEVDAVGGRGVVGTLTVPPPPPRPAGPPGAVSAVGGDQSALVSWVAPSSSGSFPVSNYQVVGSPSGSCLVPTATLSCEVSGLGNGVEYSFRVRALTGAGWGAWSESVTVVPEPPAPEPSILITGSREGSSVVVEGVTTGLVGEQVTPWVRFPGPYSYESGAGVRTVGEDGTFTWQRQTRKKIYVYFRAEDDVRSNRVIIRP